MMTTSSSRIGLFNRVSVLCLLLVSTAFAADHWKAEEMRSDPPQPDPKVQAFINGILSTNQLEMFAGTEDQLQKKLAQLQDMVGGDHKKLVEQLFCYRVNAKGMRQALLPMVIMKQLGVSDDTLVQGTVPYLESSDAHVKKEASEWLRGTDKDRATREHDFGRYKSLLEKNKPSVPSGLIQYMFDRDPQAAVVTVAQVYDPDVSESEVAAKAKSGTKESVNYFADRPEWWAHLYVAETMKKQPQLRDAAILKKLEKDDNPLVKEKVAEITSGK